MNGIFERVAKVFAGLVGIILLLFLLFFFWPQKHSPKVAARPSPTATASFSGSHQAPASKNEAPSNLEFPTQKTPSVQHAINDFEVPHGAILPAVLMDNGSTEKNPIADEMLISMEGEFFQELQEAKSKGIAPQEIWEELRSKYDERYIALFGQDAYLEATSVAAEEAREDFETATARR
jgi:hypothetical protein